MSTAAEPTAAPDAEKVHAIARTTPPAAVQPATKKVDVDAHFTRNTSVTTPFGAGRVDDLWRNDDKMPPLPAGNIFDHKRAGTEKPEPITAVAVELPFGRACIRDVATHVKRQRLYEMGSAERMHFALSLKGLGNARFGAGDYAAAAQAYDQALVYVKNALTGEVVRAEGDVPASAVRRQVELWLAIVCNLGRARMRSDARAEQKKAVASLGDAVTLCTERLTVLDAEKQAFGDGTLIGDKDKPTDDDAAGTAAFRKKLNDGLVKAHYLIHSAHKRMGDLTAARKELRLVARARPGQKRYATELAKLEALIKRKKKKNKKKGKKMFGNIFKKAAANDAATAAATAATAGGDAAAAANGPATASPPIDTNTKEGRIAEQKRKWSISAAGKEPTAAASSSSSRAAVAEDAGADVPPAASAPTAAEPEPSNAAAKDGDGDGAWPSSTWAMVAGGVALAVVVGVALARRR